MILVNFIKFFTHWKVFLIKALQWKNHCALNSKFDATDYDAETILMVQKRVDVGSNPCEEAKDKAHEQAN